jgi:hypothetical protein
VHGAGCKEEGKNRALCALNRGPFSVIPSFQIGVGCRLSISIGTSCLQRKISCYN